MHDGSIPLFGFFGSGDQVAERHSCEALEPELARS